jgi:polysaccharide export outer membrane protein
MMNMKKLLIHAWLLLLLSCAVLAFSGCQTTPPSHLPVSSAGGETNTDAIVLRAGDAIKVAFPGSPNLDTAQPIRRDGKIVMPLVGEVEAAGLSPDALQTKLVNLYKSQISSSEVLVTLESSSFPVYVTGAVVHSGKVNSDHPITALEAVMEAGGFDYNTANMKAVKVNRTENGVTKIYILNLKDALEVGKKKPFYLKPNDILFVPQRLQIF